MNKFCAINKEYKYLKVFHFLIKITIYYDMHICHHALMTY
jgi:hypothetical protein